jgi:hypothetical protein
LQWAFWRKARTVVSTLLVSLPSATIILASGGSVPKWTFSHIFYNLFIFLLFIVKDSQWLWLDNSILIFKNTRNFLVCLLVLVEILF